MRLSIVFAAAAACALAGPASADTATATLADLGISVNEAGQASYFALFACGLPPSQVDAMKEQMERATPGSTHSPAFNDGVSQATRAVQEARQGASPDDSELTSQACPQVTSLIRKLKAAQSK